jgi:IPT/TIG domain
MPYDIVVQPKEPKGAEKITYEGAFNMMAPEITSVDPASGSTPDEIVISGNYFGTKKGKVYLEDQVSGKKKTCKIITWGMDSITFMVPKTSKSFPANAYLLKVTNKVGEESSTFTVE